MRVWLRTISFIVFLTCFSGCSTYNAATGRKEFIVISTPEEVSMGKDIHKQLENDNKFSTDQAKISRLERIGEKLSQVSDRQDYVYNFYLIEKDELNAFTTPGGNIYVYTGLLDRLKTDDQVASVLAHEIGHCSARHTVKKFQAALGYSLIGGIVFDLLSADKGTKQVAAMTTDVAMNLIFSAYSRNDEFQADKLGIKYMYLAGYDLNGMVETFEVLNKESKGGDVPLLFRSHPYTTDRIERAKKEIEIIKQQLGS